MNTRLITVRAIADAVADVSKVFETRFGQEPAGVWSAPGRVNLIGEHTDYNAGLCLPMALPHRTYVAASTLSTPSVELVSAQEDGNDVRNILFAEVEPGADLGWAGYVAGVGWALGFERIGGFRLAVDSDVPYGAGLSSSAALESATAVALSDLHGLGLSGSEAGRAEMVAASISAENEVVGAATGGMDQSASLLSEAGSALLLDFASGSHKAVTLDFDGGELAVLVIDTKAPHQLVDGQYASRRRSCEVAAAQLGVQTLREIEPTGLSRALENLRDETTSKGELWSGELLAARVRHVVTENARVERFVSQMASGQFEEAGATMDESHRSLRDDYEVSCAELDVAVEAARVAGALGARMTGGGFGGSAVALVPQWAVAHVTVAVEKAFRVRGFNSPSFLLATPEGPARRDR